MQFHKESIDRQLTNFTAYGVDALDGQGIIVSLTSFPQRLQEIHYCLYSLLCQSLKPWKLILWLGREEFPGGEADIPQIVLGLRRNGLEIRWTKDIKQYKKLVPALEAFGDRIIVTADDDVVYRHNWLALLYRDYARQDFRPMVYAHRAHRIRLDREGNAAPYRSWFPAKADSPGISCLYFPTGCGGTLYPPDTLHPDVGNEDLFTELAPYSDDIFFWAMAMRRCGLVRVVEKNIAATLDINPDRNSGRNKGYTLMQHNLHEGQNDAQMSRVLARYPELLDMLRQADQPHGGS